MSTNSLKTREGSNKKQITKQIAVALNTISVLLFLLLVLIGEHLIVAVLLGSNTLLNYLILLNILNEKHPYVSMASSIISIISNICFALIGIVILFLGKGIFGFFASSWILLTSLMGVYFANRLWKEIPRKVAFNTSDPHILFERTPVSQLEPITIKAEPWKAKNWKEKICYVKDPSNTHVVVTLALYIFLGLCFYPMLFPVFFPSTSWSSIGGFLILIPGALSFFWAVKLVFSERLNLRRTKDKKGIPFSTVLFLPVIAWFFLYLCFFLSIPHIYTNFFGSETAMVVPVEKTDRTSRSPGRYGGHINGYCFDTPTLKHSFLSDLCIPKEAFDKAPRRFFMTLIGKQSYFGSVYNKYIIGNTYAFDNDKKIKAGIESPVYAESEYQLALRYIHGDDVSKDYTQAIKHLLPAAYQKHTNAQFLLGLLYSPSIKEVDEDLEKSIFWLTKAADQGLAKAQELLAILYIKEDLESYNPSKAAEFFLKAAKQGLTKSQFFTGILYATGKGHLLNKEEAYFWFSLASDNGNNNATKARDKLAPYLTIQQISRIEERIKNWKPETTEPQNQ